MNDKGKIATDVMIGVGGVAAGLSLEKVLAITVSVSTLALIWLRIWISWKHRNDKPGKD